MCYRCNDAAKRHNHESKSMSAQPNKSEIAVLKHLWTNGEQSAREVHQGVADETGWSYSTTRTIINRMADKEWVNRRDAHGIAVFSAALSKVAVLGGMVKDLTRKVFEIEGELPVSMFAGSPHLSDTDLDELEQLINTASSGDEESKS